MRILKNHNHINVDWVRGKTSNRVNSHRPVIFPFFKRSIQIPKPTVAHWGFENPGLFQKSLVIKLLKHRNNTQQCALTVSYTHRQPSHILINMWSRTFLSPPLPPPNCANIPYQTIAWGWAKSCNSVFLWAGHGRKRSRQDDGWRGIWGGCVRLTWVRH